MTNCKKCNNEVVGLFCSFCGQADKINRIDKHYLSNELQHLLHFEKGFFFTARELIVRPGHSIREYMVESRVSHMKPIPFLILTSLFYTIISSFFHNGGSGIDKTAFANTSVVSIFHWVDSHLGYANIILGVFVSLFVKLFFKKFNYNIYEIAVLITFIMGEEMLFLSIKSLIFGIFKIEVSQQIISLVTYAYATWAIGQFFNKNSFGIYFKAFLSYALGMTAFVFISVLIGLMVDLIFKH